MFSKLYSNRFFKKVHQLGFWRRLHAELKLTQSVFPVPPRTIDIELTNICNQKCVFCATGLETNERPQGMITFETFKNILEFAYPKTNIQLAGYGEPFLHKELEKFLLHANQRGLNRVEIYSNFAALNENRIRGLLDYPFKRLIISLDAMSKDTFQEYKGIDQFDIVVRNIEILADEARKRNGIKQELVVQMVTSQINLAETEKFEDFVKKLGMTPKIKTLNTRTSFASEESKLKFEIPEKSRYKNNTDFSHKCHWMWGGMMIFWNGDVTICCQDPTGLETFGNVNEKNVVELLNYDSQKVNFRQRYYDDPAQIGLFKDCENA